MTPTVAAALADVAQLMRPARHPWWIIGSGAVVLHGAEAGDVHDIDVLIDPADAPAVLAAAGVAPLTMPPDPLFRSDIFAVWQGADVPVEIMAGFAIAGPQGWSPVCPQRGRRSLCVMPRSSCRHDRSWSRCCAAWGGLRT
ncbi:hypothetical protein MOP88_12530 [Sphingomonas sp. WKB10]|nr:hypothetical protein [Sphingomonas sp. WKB10]